MRHRVLSALFFLALTGCATKPPTAKLLAGLSSATTIDSPNSTTSEGLLVAKLNTTTTIEIDSNSRVLSYGGYRSYYKAIEVKPDANGSIKFQIESICACLGFDKRVAVPVVIAVDASGKEIQITDMKYATKSADFRPFRIVMQGSVANQKDSAVRLLLLADNSSVDQPIKKTQLLNQYGAYVMSTEILSYPKGTFVLTLDPGA
jgi:hypothetical protein